MQWYTGFDLLQSGIAHTFDNDSGCDCVIPIDRLLVFWFFHTTILTVLHFPGFLVDSIGPLVYDIRENIRLAFDSPSW